MDSVGILTFAGLIILLVIAALAFGFWIMGRLFRRASRFDALAEYYAVTPRRGPFEKSQLWRTVKIGNVIWRQWVDIAVEAEGLYLGINFGFRKHAFLIPWMALHESKETHIYWRPAVEMEVGDLAIVNIVVYKEVYRKMEPYMQKMRPITFGKAE